MCVTLEPVPVMALTEDLSSEGVGGHMATEQLHRLRAGSSCMLQTCPAVMLQWFLGSCCTLHGASNHMITVSEWCSSHMLSTSRIQARHCSAFPIL